MAPQAKAGPDSAQWARTVDAHGAAVLDYQYSGEPHKTRIDAAALGGGAGRRPDERGERGNLMAPPAQFLQHAYLPLPARMEEEVDLELIRDRFYPAGGGEVIATIRPYSTASATP